MSLQSLRACMFKEGIVLQHKQTNKQVNKPFVLLRCRLALQPVFKVQASKISRATQTNVLRSQSFCFPGDQMHCLTGTLFIRASVLVVIKAIVVVVLLLFGFGFGLNL